MSQTDEKNLYVKISLKNIENDSDNFETVTNELEYCYIIQEVKVTWQKAPHGGPFPG